MPHLQTILIRLGWGLVIVLLTACGNAQQVSPTAAWAPAQTQPHLLLGGATVTRSLMKSRPALYVAGLIQRPGYVEIYSQKGQDQPELGQISQGLDGPWAVFVDPQRNLYVGSYNTGTVTVYPPGEVTPSETLTGAGKPIGIVVDPMGTVYVSDQGAGQIPPSQGQVLEYAKGKTTPSNAIAFPAGAFPYGMAIDSSNDLFVARDRYNSKSATWSGGVLRFTAGSSKGVDTGIKVGEIGELTIDKNDNLLLVDMDRNSVQVFAPGQKKPWKTISGFPGGAIMGIAINERNNEIWVSCPWCGQIFGVTYPGGKIVDTIAHRLGWALGVSVSPNGSR